MLPIFLRRMLYDLSRNQKGSHSFCMYRTPRISPLLVSQKMAQQVKNVEPERRQYVACLEHMDDSISQIIDTILKVGRDDNILIIFF